MQQQQQQQEEENLEHVDESYKGGIMMRMNMRENQIGSMSTYYYRSRNTLSEWLGRYKEWMIVNRPMCQLLEDSMSRMLLYIAPTSGMNHSRVEIGYAILNIWSLLHDVLLLQLEKKEEEENGLTIGYTNNHQKTIVLFTKLSITLLEYIAPAVEVTLCKNHHHQPLIYMEQIKCILRFVLLGIAYYTKNNNNKLPKRCLLQHGGMYLPSSSHHHPSALEEEHQYQKLTYRGKRTGKSCTPTSTTRIPDTNTTSTLWGHSYKWLLADTLHIIRPLYWTSASSSSSSSSEDHSFGLWKAYWTSLAMDIISQKLVTSSHPYSNKVLSPSTLLEIQRRKQKLWFYLLRSPFWNTTTFPFLQRLIAIVSTTKSSFLSRLLLQPIVDYIMNTLHYYQSHHFMLES